jgi:ABC-type multidrug transport system fused ATPase/permease subunit
VSNKSRSNKSRSTQASGNPRARARKPSSNRPQPTVGRPTREAPVAPATGARRTLEVKTGPLLVMIHSMPRWVLPVSLAAALFFGLLLDGSWAWLGAILLGVIAVFLAWLLALSWPLLSTSSRLIRSVVVLAVGGLAVLKALGRW